MKIQRIRLRKKNKMDKKKKNEEINPRLTFISCYPDCYSYRWVKITS